MLVSEVLAALQERDLVGQVELRALCSSTNEVAAGLPRSSTVGQGWALIAAEEQSAGRGRLDRSWSSPPGAGLLFSVLLDVPSHTDPATVGFAPLVAGVAVARACRAVGVPAVLKWPNDVLAAATTDGAGGKLAGILVERPARGVVVGVGLNVSLTEAESSVPTATSLLSAGADLRAGRAGLLADCTARIVGGWRALLRDGPSGLLVDYRQLCGTLGRPVEVILPGDVQCRGTAVEVDDEGHLVVATDTGEVTVMAGDVIHARALD